MTFIYLFLTGLAIGYILAKYLPGKHLTGYILFLAIIALICIVVAVTVSSLELLYYQQFIFGMLISFDYKWYKNTRGWT